MKGIFSGKLIKKDVFGPQEEIQTGPLHIPKIPHPADELLNSITGKFPFEANGLCVPKEEPLDPSKIEYLKS